VTLAPALRVFDDDDDITAHSAVVVAVCFFARHGHGRRSAGRRRPRRGVGDEAVDGAGPPGVAAVRRREGVRAAGHPRAAVQGLGGQRQGGPGDAGGDERRHAGPRLPRLHRARDAAVPRVGVALRQGVPDVVRLDSGAVRGQPRHGEAGPVRQGGAVRQDGPGAHHTVPHGQGPRVHRRRRLVAPPPRRAPGVRHGQAQVDDGGHGGVRGGGDPGVGGARRGERGGGGAGGDGGGGAAVHGAHRRRDLAHRVRQQLPSGEGGVPGAAGAPVHRLRLHQQRHARAGHAVRAHQGQRAPVASRAHGAGHAHGHHRRAPRRREGGEGVRQRPARPHAGGQRRRRRRQEAAAGHEHGRDHRRVQDLLLRRPRHDLAPPHLGHVPPRHAPRVAAAAQGGGGPRVRRRRGAPQRRRPQQAQAREPPPLHLKHKLASRVECGGGLMLLFGR
jgi:hypothetical protein